MESIGGNNTSSLAPLVKLEIVKPVNLPNDILIYITNDSGDIIVLKRIILTVEYYPNEPIIQASYYLRKDEFYAGEEVEETGRLIFASADHVWTAGTFFRVKEAVCTAEYIKVSERAKSKVYHF